MKIKSIVFLSFFLLLCSYSFSQECDDETLLWKLNQAIVDNDNTEAIKIINENKSIINCNYENSYFIWNAIEQPEVVTALLENGADLNLIRRGSLLFFSLINETKNKEILEKIIEEANKNNLLNITSDGVYHKGTSAFLSACAAHNLAAIELLLNYDVDVNATTKDGKTAFMLFFDGYAAHALDEDKIINMMKLFIDKVDNIMIKDNNEKTVLDYANESNKYKIKKYLQMEDLKRKHKDNPEMLKRIEERKNRNR